jgi:hypothetical protein
MRHLRSSPLEPRSVRLTSCAALVKLPVSQMATKVRKRDVSYSIGASPFGDR